jgi:hypothetical protein
MSVYNEKAAKLANPLWMEITYRMGGGGGWMLHDEGWNRTPNCSLFVLAVNPLSNGSSVHERVLRFIYCSLIATAGLPFTLTWANTHHALLHVCTAIARRHLTWHPH